MIDWDSLVLAPLQQIFGDAPPASGQGAFIYTSKGGPRTFGIGGIFDEAYREVDLVSGTAATTVMPVLGVRLVEFPTPPLQDDTLVRVLTGESYIVKEVRPDSHGWAKLMLNQVPLP